MDRYVVTRAELADPALAAAPVALLTGPWPRKTSPTVVELDDVIDGRFAWIDREAERLAEVAGRGSATCDRLPAAWVNALPLRYYLVKLIRIAVYFTEVDPIGPSDRLRVIAHRSDGDEAQLMTLLCRRVGARCDVEWRGRRPAGRPSGAQEEWWRTWLTRLANCFPTSTTGDDRRPRVVLCGNPRFLDPICQALGTRDCRVWWLYDRLAVKPLLRWRRKGVGQLTLEERVPPPRTGEDATLELPSLEFRGLELHDLVASGLRERLASRGADQGRWQRRITEHFETIQPDFLVMDEDATAMKRIAVAVARRYGAPSYVVQHGAPTTRFGFAPLIADGIFAWGNSSRDRLQRWGIPGERVFVTGVPGHEEMRKVLRKPTPVRTPSDGGPRILLLATVPPRDHRPDSIELHLNTRTYGEMLEAAFSAVESIPGARLMIRPHPRSGTDAFLQAAIDRHPQMEVEMRAGGSLAASLEHVDCVLSCLSSAGIEATLAGLPVIQLLPRGCGDVLPHDRWGLFGSATTADELTPQIQAACSRGIETNSDDLGDVFAELSTGQCRGPGRQNAADRIASQLLDRAHCLAAAKQRLRLSRNKNRHGCREPIVGETIVDR